MKRLLFLSRIAFICNLFFLLTVVMHWSAFFENQAIVSTIIIIGYMLAVFIFNPIVNIAYITLLLLHKKLPVIVPRWLVFSNFVFLLLQLIYLIFILNDT